MSDYIAIDKMVVIGRTTTGATSCLEIRKGDKLLGSSERRAIYRNGKRLGNFDPIYLQTNKIKEIKV